MSPGTLPLTLQPLRTNTCESIRRDSNGSAGVASANGVSTSGSLPDEQLCLFREGAGRVKYELVEENANKCKELKRRAKELATTINAIKRSMDELKARRQYQSTEVRSSHLLCNLCSCYAKMNPS